MRPTLNLLVLCAALLGVGTARAQDYVDPPVHGLTHAAQWIIELGPAFVYQLRSSLAQGARSDAMPGLSLRVARGLPQSGNELGVQLGGLLRDGALGVSLSGGYRLNAGRERWKTLLELDAVLLLQAGVFGGLLLRGGVLYDLGPGYGLLIEGGAGGALGGRVLGWVLLRTALQLRF